MLPITLHLRLCRAVVHFLDPAPVASGAIEECIVALRLALDLVEADPRLAPDFAPFAAHFQTVPSTVQGPWRARVEALAARAKPFALPSTPEPVEQENIR